MSVLLIVIYVRGFLFLTIVALSLVCFFLFPLLLGNVLVLSSIAMVNDHHGFIQFPHAECAVVYQQVMDILRQCPEESEDAYELQTILQKPNLRVSVWKQNFITL